MNKYLMKIISLILIYDYGSQVNTIHETLDIVLILAFQLGQLGNVESGMAARN